MEDTVPDTGQTCNQCSRREVIFESPYSIKARAISQDEARSRHGHFDQTTQSLCVLDDRANFNPAQFPTWHHRLCTTKNRYLDKHGSPDATSTNIIEEAIKHYSVDANQTDTVSRCIYSTQALGLDSWEAPGMACKKI
jgi:hypothetical protein